MLDLFTNYDVSEILVFFIVFCLAIKETITFYDWAKTRINQGYNKNLKEKEDKDKIERELEEMNKTFKEKEMRFAKKKEEINSGLTEMKEQIQYINDQMKLLIDSDKDDIKAYIVEKHHLFVYEKGWIDDYSLDCLEKRYNHYTIEGGNSFIADLMNELRALPKQPPSAE